MPQDRKTYGHIEYIDDSRAKEPLACIEENNFFPKTFGSITEKVYLCMQSLIIRRLIMNIEEKKQILCVVSRLRGSERLNT